MNQKQREFLVKTIENQADTQIRALQKSKPAEPDLNNYMIAEILQGTAKFKDMETLREHVKDLVVQHGVDKQLLQRDTRGRRNWLAEADESKPWDITVHADKLFEFPEAYKKAYAEWQEQINEINEKIENLEAQRNTLVMKIQIGSTKALDRLVSQVDDIGNLALVDQQLKLASGE